MAQDLIIGGVQNYGINQLKPWVESIEEHIPDAHRVLCVNNITDETKKWLSNKGFELVDMPTVQIPVHVLRFLSIYEYLRENEGKFRYVITTDVKDVYFQKNPFEYLIEENIGINGKKLIAGSESIRYKDEGWGNENLLQAYGPYVHNLFKDNIIYNVGVLAGDAEYVKDLVFNIFINGINRPISIVDQAVYNVLINTQPYKNVVSFKSQENPWAVQLGTTGDPSKIKGFRPFLTDKEPIFDFEDGLVKTSSGLPFYVVHQYDRVPDWAELVRKKYNQENPNEYFTYRV